MLPAQFGETVEVGIRAHLGTAVLDCHRRMLGVCSQFASCACLPTRPLRLRFLSLETVIEVPPDISAHAHPIVRRPSADFLGNRAQVKTAITCDNWPGDITRESCTLSP